MHFRLTFRGGVTNRIKVDFLVSKKGKRADKVLYEVDLQRGGGVQDKSTEIALFTYSLVLIGRLMLSANLIRTSYLVLILSTNLIRTRS